MTDSPSKDPSSDQPHRRRKRYGGTHPRRFDERYKELEGEKYAGMHEHIQQQGRTPAGAHVPVMLQEVIDVLSPQPGQIVADCTIGYGAHAMAFMEKICPTGKLIGLDLDAAQLERTRKRFAALQVPISLHHSNYAGLGKVMATEGIAGYDIIFADLGVSSMQIDDPSRGFSYKQDGPLDMRMDLRKQKTAADLVNTLSQDELTDKLWELADEEDHAAIAEAIVEQRTRRPIERTLELSDLVLKVKGFRRHQWKEHARQHRELHPAARTFQALRIMVNNEHDSLRELLRVVPFCLKPGGCIAMLTFQSGEDRMVERAFAAALADETFEAISTEALHPSSGEVASNPRSRPARLRWARRADTQARRKEDTEQ